MQLLSAWKTRFLKRLKLGNWNGNNWSNNLLELNNNEIDFLEIGLILKMIKCQNI